MSVADGVIVQPFLIVSGKNIDHMTNQKLQKKKSWRGGGEPCNQDNLIIYAPSERAKGLNI